MFDLGNLEEGGSTSVFNDCCPLLHVFPSIQLYILLIFYTLL